MKICTMTHQTFVVLGLIAASIFSLANPGAATPLAAVQEMQNLKIEGHYYTTAISSSYSTVSVKDPLKARYLVLVLSATFTKNEGKIFGRDFSVRYFHRDGNEDRSGNDAIVISDTTQPEKVFDLGEFQTRTYSAIKPKSGKNRFALAFAVEPDVEDIELYRLGVAVPLPYHIGTDRLYSIFLSTNSDKKALVRAKAVIQQGGYNVLNASEDLNKEVTGITIHYSEQAESQAREISQRLMTELGKTPKIEKMALVVASDIVVWLGK